MAYREYAEATNIWDTLHCSMWKGGVGDFHGLLWVTECLKTYELLGFVKQLNHRSIDAIHIGIPILNVCKFYR